MGLISIPHIYFPDTYRFATSSGLGMGTTRTHSGIFMIPKAGSITKIGFRTGSVRTAQTIRVGIETVGTTTGYHTGTQYGGSAVGTQTSPASNTYYEVTLATPATAVQGDVVAVVIQWNSTLGDMDIISGESIGIASNFPYWDEETSGSHNLIRRWPNFSLGYSDGTYPDYGGFPAVSFNQNAYTVVTSPDERALKFQIPFAARIIGAHFRQQLGTAADFDVVLYDSASTALTTQSIDGNQWQGTGADSGRIYFDASQLLVANTTYRLSIKPTTGNSAQTVEFQANANAKLEQCPGGINFTLSYRTDVGSWTDDTTSQPAIALILDQIPDGGIGRQLVVTGSRNY